MFRHPSVRWHSQCSKIFFSETALPIKAKFYVEPPWVGGTIFCSWHLGHMTKMAPLPYMVKTIQKSSSPEPAGRFPRNLVCSIGDSSPSLYPRHLCRGVYSFPLSVRMFVRNSVTFVEFASKFCVKWCISQQLLIRKHSYLDHSYPGGLAFTP